MTKQKKKVLKLLSVITKGQREPEDFGKKCFKKCYSRTVKVSMPTNWCCIHVVPLNTKSCFNIPRPVCYRFIISPDKKAALFHSAVIQVSVNLPRKPLLRERNRGISQTKKMSHLSYDSWQVIY